MAGTALRIPHVISASTPKGLMRSMLDNNLKDGFEYRYFDISFVNNKWHAWYYKQISIEEKNERILKEIKSK